LIFPILVAQLSEWLGAIAVAWLFSLSPRLQKPPVGFKYARRDGIMALSLFALILLFAFIYYGQNPPTLAETPHPAPVVDLGQALFAAALSLAAIAVAVVVRRQPVRSAGWNPPLTMPALQMGFAIAILTIFLRNRVMDVLAGLSSDQLILLLLAAGISLAEEAIFRGYIQMRLSWWLGPWGGIALTALMFTLWHAPTWINRAPLETQLWLSGLTFIQGLVLGWIMRKSGHIIAPAFYRAISIWMNGLG